MFCLDEYQVENAVKSAMETFDAMFKNKDTNILTPEYIADIFNQMKSMPLEVQMGIVVHMCKDTTICSAVNTQQAYMDWLVTNMMALTDRAGTGAVIVDDLAKRIDEARAIS